MTARKKSTAKKRSKSALRHVNGPAKAHRGTAELKSMPDRSSRSVRKRENVITRLKKLAELSVTLAGDPIEVFNKISHMIAELLNVPLVCLSEIRGDELYLLSVYNRGAVTTDVGHCPLHVTPCATVEDAKDIRIYQSVAKKFPQAGFLEQHDAYSYCGFPSLDSAGNVIAVTCLLDDKPHEFTDEDKDLLKIFAQRIGVEIERKKIMTEHLRSEENLQRSEEKYRSLVESTEDSIYVVDRNYRYLFMNRKHLTRVGAEHDLCVGRHYSEFHSPEETQNFIDKVNTVLETGKSIVHEYRAHRDDRFFLRTLSPVRGSGGEITAVTVVSKDITRRKQLEEDLRALTLTDELTGLYNRRGFLTLARQQLRIANRLQKGAFLFSADMDNLKGINDQFGHQIGDMALIETADLLKKNFRESDVIARIGGDEFVVFLIEHTDANWEILARRLQDILTIYNSQGRRPYTLSLSIGTARFDPAGPETIEGLMDRADRMMYEQKRAKPKP